MKVTNPISDKKRSNRMYRGGNWYYNTESSRLSAVSGRGRSDRDDYLGFRLARNK